VNQRQIRGDCVECCRGDYQRDQKYPRRQADQNF